MEVRYSDLFSILTPHFYRSCFFWGKKGGLLLLMLLTNDSKSYRRTKGGAPWCCSNSLQNRCDRNRSFLPKTRSHDRCHLVTVTKILQNG